MCVTAKSTEDENPSASSKLGNALCSGAGGDVYLKMDAETEADLLAVEAIPESALELVKRELINEIAELEWEFKQIKEALFAERIAQVDRKLQQLRSSEAPELLKIAELVDDSYSMRKQVAKHRRDFELEVANKEFDNALQTATYDAEEHLRTTGECIRLRIQEAICALQVEHAMVKRTRRTPAKTSGGGGTQREEPLRQQNAGFDHSHHHPEQRSTSLANARLSAEVAALMIPGLDDEDEEEEEEMNEERNAERIKKADEVEKKVLTSVVVLDPYYLPGVDLEPRRKPVTLSPSFPRLIYELDEEDIHADIEAITNAIKEQKINKGMSYLKSKERES